MYPTGSWAGVWQQEGWGRQPMKAFDLSFESGVVRGSGHDVIGTFRVFGEYESESGELRFAKHYFDAHTVLYTGEPDGEGGVIGKWFIKTGNATGTGSFSLKPNYPYLGGNEEIMEIMPDD